MHEKLIFNNNSSEPSMTCLSDGEWISQRSRCVCQAGYEPNRDNYACIRKYYYPDLISHYPYRGHKRNVGGRGYFLYLRE